MDEARPTRSRERWTDEQKETIRSLRWDRGLSASQIADRVTADWGGDVITRNMILGVLHRGGWSGASARVISRAQRRKVVRAPMRPPAFGYASSKSSPIPRDPKPLPVEDTKPAGCLSLAHVDPKQEVRHDSCRWFYGDPLADPAGFCPKTKHPGTPYCEFHARKSFLPPQVKSRSTQVSPRSTGPQHVPSTVKVETVD